MSKKVKIKCWCCEGTGIALASPEDSTDPCVFCFGVKFLWAELWDKKEGASDE